MFFSVSSKEHTFNATPTFAHFLPISSTSGPALLLWERLLMLCYVTLRDMCVLLHIGKEQCVSQCAHSKQLDVSPQTVMKW